MQNRAQHSVSALSHDRLPFVPPAIPDGGTVQHNPILLYTETHKMSIRGNGNFGNFG